MFLQKKDIVITHSGSFHSDDVFAAATIHLYYQKIKKSYKIIRTVDSEVIETGTIVFDIGGIYNKETNRFDHHQKGGAGERENGIPYAAFGLVWKKFGSTICGAEEIADEIDKHLVQAIDAADNGISLSQNTHESAHPVFVQSLLQSFNLTHVEDTRLSDHRFDDAMHIAVLYLARVIHQTKIQHELNVKIKEIYESQKDKNILVVDEPFGRVPLSIAVDTLSDVLYFIYPSKRDEGWNICASRVSPDSFETKKPFPESWRGLKDDELEKISGISDATFCHNSGFLCATKTKESALELAQKALKA